MAQAASIIEAALSKDNGNKGEIHDASSNELDGDGPDAEEASDLLKSAPASSNARRCLTLCRGRIRLKGRFSTSPASL